jgi:hypothetical protein
MFGCPFNYFIQALPKWSLLHEPEAPYNNETPASETKCINLKVICD